MSSFLQQYQRQPKLFIDLPSKGLWYNDTIIEGEQYVQIPVFGMNAMDEIMFKTPDALFTGEATAEVIRSCIPTILDPWQLVGYDIDYILIAIRIATYGDSIDTECMCPYCQESSSNGLSLTQMLSGFNNYETSFSFTLNELTFNLKPITYKVTSEFSVENYHNERELFQIQMLKDISDSEKNKKMQNSYNKSSTINVKIAISHIESITKDEDIETSIESITEFVVNNDAEFFKILRDKIKELTQRWNLPQFEIICPAPDCGKKFKTSLELDYSNFFGASSLRSRNLI
jgi:predicted DNA binding CopG/RHH family protein|tara:strand:- start:357 stop:1220 length:864 start_codon:yes stop_codon:yes gene_type:complete